MCVVNFMLSSFYSPRRRLFSPVPGTHRTRAMVPPGRVWTLWRKQNLYSCLEPNYDTLVVQTIARALTYLRCVPTNRVESSPIRRTKTLYSAASLRLFTMVTCGYAYTLAESNRVESSFTESKVLTPHVFIPVSLTSVIGREGCCFGLRNDCCNVDYFNKYYTNVRQHNLFIL